MHKVKFQLDLWRDAERRRDGLALGSPERQEAEIEVRSAETTFHAELAQETARYAEEEFQDQGWDWSAPLTRQTSEAAK